MPFLYNMSWCRSVWVYLIWDLLCFLLGFPRWLSGSTCNARARGVSSVSVGKIPWRRACQPTPVFLRWESHEQSRISVSFYRFGKFSAMITSDNFRPPSGSHLIGGFACLILSHRSLILLSFFSFGFLSAVLIEWFPLFYLPGHFFIILHCLSCCSLVLAQLSSLQMNFLIVLGSL